MVGGGGVGTFCPFFLGATDSVTSLCSVLFIVMDFTVSVLLFFLCFILITEKMRVKKINARYFMISKKKLYEKQNRIHK